MMMNHCIDLISLLKVLSPTLLRSLREQSLQGLTWNLEVALVKCTFVIEDLTTREQEVLAKMASFELYEQKIKECLHNTTAYLKVL
mgnify:CR=1 FL=1